MSFSSDTKRELCRTEINSKEEMTSECYGMLLYCKRFGADNIVFSTENYFVANRFCELMSVSFGVITEKTSVLTERHGGGSIFTVSLPVKSECERVFKYFGYVGNEISRRINNAMLEDDVSVSAFLRGAFLSCGSVNNPEKDYHLEFAVPYRNLCRDLVKLISSVDRLMYTLKIVERKGIYVAYLKDSEQISDLLAFMNAPIASMSIIETKIIKEIRNNTNRKINSEVANMKKTITASMKQIKAIEKLCDCAGLESLSSELRDVAVMRLENPDMSLRDIGKNLNPPISRSGVNHRLKKLMELAEEYSTQK